MYSTVMAKKITKSKTYKSLLNRVETVMDALMATYEKKGLHGTALELEIAKCEMTGEKFKDTKDG